MEAGGAEVEVVTCQRVSTDAAAVGSTKKVAAELGGPRHVGYVAAQPVAEKSFDLGAVVLYRHTRQLVDFSAPEPGPR